MPFIDDLLIYKNDYFVETGTYQGDTVNDILNNGFKFIYSIELSDVFYYNCVKRFINNSNVKLFKGNSRYDLFKMIANINTPITFWLDGHWSGVQDVGCDKDLRCPVLCELEQIKNHHIKTHTIMVDDSRLMDGIHFNVTKEEIEEKIMEINPNYKLKYYDDNYSQNDILVAYVDKENAETYETKYCNCIHKYLTKCKTNPQPPGLADFLRGSISLFNYSQKYNYNFYFDDSHLLFKYLLKHPSFITNGELCDAIELLPPLTYETIDDEIQKLFLKKQSFCILTNAFYTKNNNAMENFGDIPSECKKFLRQVFTPNECIKEDIINVYNKLNINLRKEYSVIHLRFGDNYIRENVFNEKVFDTLNAKVKNILNNNKSNQIILLSDSSSMAKELQKDNPELFYWDNTKIHMGELKNENAELGVKDALIDFFIMTQCDKIYCHAFHGISGFSKLVSLIYDKEYIYM